MKGGFVMRIRFFYIIYIEYLIDLHNVSDKKVVNVIELQYNYIIIQKNVFE